MGVNRRQIGEAHVGFENAGVQLKVVMVIAHALSQQMPQRAVIGAKATYDLCLKARGNNGWA